MGDYGSGSLQPAGHMGRIPNFKNNHGENFQTRCAAEPPACVQNAMMTKDKKPFTYTPGGLDLSQIRTPSMARRLNKQQHSLEEQDSPTHNRSQLPYPNGNSHLGGGGGVPPPPPPPPMAGPPPPPPLLIQAPNAKSAKPIVPGIRPEIVIPENPIGMLRKTHSPYHWESENVEKQNQGLKFVEKSATPSPVHPQINATPSAQFSQHPQQFSQQPPQQYYQQQKQPQTYAPPAFQETPFQNRNQAPLAQQSIGSPVHKPEPKYPTPQQNTSSPVNGDPNMRDLLQRQDSQFNNSPAPWTLGSQQNSPQLKSQVQSPSPSNASPINTNGGSPWRKPDSNNSPLIYQNDKPTFVSPANSDSMVQTQNRNNTPQSSTFSSPISNKNNSNSFSSGAPTPLVNRSPFSSPASPQISASQIYTDMGKISPQQNYPANNQSQVSSNAIFNNCYNANHQEPNAVGNATTAPWRNASQTSSTQYKSNNIPEETRYQTSMSIPVTPRNNVPEQPTQQKECVYVTQEPVYYHSPESPKVVPGWVRSQKEKTPPPEWCQRANEVGRKSIPRDTISQDKENNAQPAWVQKANDLRKSVPKEVVSVEKDKDTQPPWVQKANELRRNIPNDMSNPPQSNQVQPTWAQKPSENRNITMNIPVKMEVSSKEVLNNGASYQTQPNNSQQPQLRIIIDMNQQGVPHSGLENASYSQPTQRIMRALQPQLVRTDRPDPNLPSINPAISPDLSSSSGQQPKTRIIPIRIEPSSPGANPKSFSIGGRS